jgi:hypothetical protein
VAYEHPQRDEKHHKQRELKFWRDHHKDVQIQLPEAATLYIGQYASLRVGLVPVEPPLQAWQDGSTNSASKLLKMTRPPNAAAAI